MVTHKTLNQQKNLLRKQLLQLVKSEQMYEYVSKGQGGNCSAMSHSSKKGRAALGNSSLHFPHKHSHVMELQK